MRRAVVFVGLALFLGPAVFAQGLPNPFDVGLGVRAEGFGGAYTALAEGTEALLYNPAGLAHLSGMRVDSSYASPMGLYSVTWIGGAMHGLGAGVAYLSAGGITDPEGNPLSFSHMAVVLGGALAAEQLPFVGQFLPWPAALGMGLKYDRVQVADEAGGGMALDIGALTSLSLPLGELRVGLAILDVGAGIGLGETRDSWSSSFVVGTALLTPGGLIASADLGTDRFAIGVGWVFLDKFEVRAGLRQEGGVARFSVGLGVNWNAFVLDYALTTHPLLGPSHRLALGISFGG